MIVIVCGGRDFRPTPGHEAALVALFKLLDPAVVIHGMARGADSWAAGIASRLGIRVKGFPYLSQHGKAGGHMRNRQMAEFASAYRGRAVCVALPGGSGTASMVRYAAGHKLGIIDLRAT